MDDADFLSLVEQLLNQLEAVTSPTAKPLVGSDQAAAWCCRQLHDLKIRYGSPPDTSDFDVLIAQKLREASEMALVAQLKFGVKQSFG